MTHLSLFSGIGGIDLAAHWAGFETIAFVEKDEFCQKVLAKNFPGVPIYGDITEFDGTRFRGVDLVSGGFPCQDISHANKRATGLDGARSGLWFQMLRVIDEAKPRYVLAENVRRLLGMGIDVCLNGLERIGYETGTVVVPAAGVGAWHRRDRVFILGTYNDCNEQPTMPFHAEAHKDTGVPRVYRATADDDSMGMQPGDGQTRAERKLRGDKKREHPLEEQAGNDVLRRIGANPQCFGAARDFGERSRLFTPKLCRNLHGLPGGMDVSRARLKALGNAVVPQQIYPILKAIAEEILA